MSKAVGRRPSGRARSRPHRNRVFCLACPRLSPRAGWRDQVDRSEDVRRHLAGAAPQHTGHSRQDRLQDWLTASSDSPSDTRHMALTTLTMGADAAQVILGAPRNDDQSA